MMEIMIRAAILFRLLLITATCVFHVPARRKRNPKNGVHDLCCMIDTVTDNDTDTMKMHIKKIYTDTDETFRNQLNSIRMLLLTPRSNKEWHMRLAPQLCISPGDAGSASADASQRSGCSEGTVVSLLIGSFNAGVNQSMMTGRTKDRNKRKIEGIITNCVNDVGLHLMSMCEVGGHLEGPSEAGIMIFDIPDGPTISVNTNYLTAWGFDADTTQLGVQEAVPNETHQLSSNICEPHLVVHHFEHGAGIQLMHGNLHIRIPHNATVSIPQRKTIVRDALEKLEKEAPSDSAAQPVVYVLVGDCNLSRDLAEEAIQPLQPQNPG